MSSIDLVEGQETRAQAYTRALEAWGQWLRQMAAHRGATRVHATLICKEIAAETVCRVAGRVAGGAFRASIHAYRANRV